MSKSLWRVRVRSYWRNGMQFWEVVERVGIRWRVVKGDLVEQEAHNFFSLLNSLNSETSETSFHVKRRH